MRSADFRHCYHQRREEAEQRAKEDEEARVAAEKAARKAAAAAEADGGDGDDDVEKLDAREVKKMNPKQVLAPQPLQRSRVHRAWGACRFHNAAYDCS